MCALDLPSAPLEKSSDWGDWRLGDLFSLVERLAGVLEGSLRVERVMVRPPAPGGVLPRVDVVVHDALSLEGFLAAVLGAGAEFEAGVQVGSGRIELEVDRVLVRVLLLEETAGGVGDG